MDIFYLRRTLKTIAFPDVFVTSFSIMVYEDGNLQKLADKGLYSCIVVELLYRFPLEIDAIMRALCHPSTASVCGSFAHHSSAFSGLFQVS